MEKIKLLINDFIKKQKNINIRYFEISKIFGFKIFNLLDLLDIKYTYKKISDRIIINFINKANKIYRIESTNGWVTSINRNSRGEILTEITINNHDVIDEYIHYYYDNFGRIIKLTDRGGNTVHITYDGYGDYLFYTEMGGLLYGMERRNKLERKAQKIIKKFNESFQT